MADQFLAGTVRQCSNELGANVPSAEVDGKPVIVGCKLIQELNIVAHKRLSPTLVQGVAKFINRFGGCQLPAKRRLRFHLKWKDSSAYPLVEKVHGSHCDPRFTFRDGWHRHWQDCERQYPKFNRSHDHWRHDRQRHKQHGEPRWR